MPVLRTIGLRFLIVFIMSYNASADDILTQLFTTEAKLAEEGNSAAMYIVGTMYEEGTGVEQNNDLAVAWYRKAAALGNREAEAKLLIVSIKRGVPPAKADIDTKATLYERARANELELKQTRERQAAEKNRQEAEQLKTGTTRLQEEQRARDRAEPEKAKEVIDKSGQAEKNALREEQLKREKAEADKALVEAEKARLEAENARLLREMQPHERLPEAFPQNSDEPADPPATANSSEFKANPCETPAARFMSTCQ